jgi:MFS transporter, DHA2 family, multidrug resistance protein
MIGYIDDFLLMMYVTLAAVPIVFLLRKPRQAAAPAEPAAVME